MSISPFESLPALRAWSVSFAKREGKQDYRVLVGGRNGSCILRPVVVEGDFKSQDICIAVGGVGYVPEQWLQDGQKIPAGLRFVCQWLGTRDFAVKTWPNLSPVALPFTVSIRGEYVCNEGLLGLRVDLDGFEQSALVKPQKVLGNLVPGGQVGLGYRISYAEARKAYRGRIMEAGMLLECQTMSPLDLGLGEIHDVTAGGPANEVQ